MTTGRGSTTSASRRCSPCGVTGRKREDLDGDPLLVDGIVRRLEMIGEAARMLSKEGRSLAPDVEWPQVVGMRHIMAHEYWRVDLDAVFLAATNDVPRILSAVEAAIAVIESSTPTGSASADPGEPAGSSPSSPSGPPPSP